MSGQCDCVLWLPSTESSSSSDNGVFCKEKGATCCGVLDNGGGVVLYFLVVFYSFLGLAIVCDNYFCESLSRISTALQLSDDVAGATFMAAGSSAPELFTSLVTVLLTGGSEGLGTIVGSAVFNMTVITGATALASCSGEGSPPTLQVWWFPLTRDCIAYFVSMAEMYVFMLDSKITWGEALVMVLTYGVYVYIMKRNTDLAAWAARWDEQRQQRRQQQQSFWSEGKATTPPHQRGSGGVGIEMMAMGGGDGAGVGGALRQAHAATTSPGSDASFLVRRATAGNPLHQPAFRSGDGGGGGGGMGVAAAAGRRRAAERAAFREDMAAAVATKRATSALMATIGREASWSNASKASPSSLSLPAAGNFDEGFGGAGEGGEEEEATTVDRVVAVLSCPLESLFAATIPDCTTPRFEKYFVATFLMSIMWIGVLSFLMSDFCIRAGCVLGIPGLLMGLVFLAAGTSVPDALSSIAVGRSGMGDMAVANVLGSNIFNILLGLGLPWLLYTLANGSSYPLNPDEPLGVFMVVLVLYLAFFLTSVYLNQWCLDVRLGKLYMGAEFCFIVFACVITFADLGV